MEEETEKPRPRWRITKLELELESELELDLESEMELELERSSAKTFSRARNVDHGTGELGQIGEMELLTGGPGWTRAEKP